MLNRILYGVLAITLFFLSACSKIGFDDKKGVSTVPTAGSGEYEPGGKWLPTQMGLHEETLKGMGLKFDPAQLQNPLSFPLGAIVSLGFCSASFVSPDGLVVTNHHCVEGYLTYIENNQGGDAKIIKEGYLAHSRDEEATCGPTARLYVTETFDEVTEQVKKGLNQIDDSAERQKKINQRIKTLTAECEAEKENTRCEISSFFEGLKYYQIRKLEIKDVRVVYSPHQDVGFFGGFVDNWRWPRHVADFAFIRAYVSPSGEARGYHVDNVPYQPKHFLPVPKNNLKENDLVFVAGYPGRSYRLKTAAEVKKDVEVTLVRRAIFGRSYLALLNELAKDEAISKKIHDRRFSLVNATQYYEGALEGLRKDRLLEKKIQIEKQLKAWIEADSIRQQKYGGVFEEMEDIVKNEAATAPTDLFLSSFVDQSQRSRVSVSRGMNVIKASYIIARKAWEAKKTDAERASAFQKRNWERLKEQQEQFQKTLDVTVEKESLKFFVTRLIQLPEDQQPEVLKSFIQKGTSDEETVTLTVDHLLGDCYYHFKEARLRDLEEADWEKLSQKKNPIVQLGMALVEVLIDLEERDKKLKGALALVRPRYVQAMNEYHEGRLAPDANSTLRVSFGTVKGYRPKPEAQLFHPFTYLEEMLDKKTEESPFTLPPSFTKPARRALSESRYDGFELTHRGVDKLPVNFIADLDITGGNSGSATINAKGEIIGLAFDGNYEAMASDWVFVPEVTRSIHVDMRFILWIMKNVDKADHLLTELKVK